MKYTCFTLPEVAISAHLSLVEHDQHDHSRFWSPWTAAISLAKKFCNTRTWYLGIDWSFCSTTANHSLPVSRLTYNLDGFEENVLSTFHFLFTPEKCSRSSRCNSIWSPFWSRGIWERLNSRFWICCARNFEFFNFIEDDNSCSIKTISVSWLLLLPTSKPEFFQETWAKLCVLDGILPSPYYYVISSVC